MAAAALCSSPGDCESHDCWPRDGPVRLRQSTTSVRRNRPAACEKCRRRRVRCTAFETGAPCESCVRHKTNCAFGGVKYAPDATSPMQIYSPVLPPPAPPASTPSVPSTPHLQLNLNVLNSALESSKPRPPPLVWESSNEHIQKGAPTTRSQKKAVEVKDEDGTVDEHEPAAPPAKRLRLSTKTARGIDTVARGMLHLETKASDKLCRIKHKRLAWSEPAHPARHFPVTALPLKDPPHLVVHSSRYQSLVALSAWKGQTRDTDCLNRSRSSCFPLSAVRDEPNHRQPYSSRPFAPAFHEPSFRSFTFPRPQFDLGTVASSSATASPSRSSWPSDFGFHQHHYRNGESSTPSSSETLQCA